MYKVGLYLLLLGMLLTGIATAQDSDEINTYTDGENRFEVMVPDGWQNLSTPERANFLNESESADLYILAVDSDELQSGIQAALEQVEAGFDSQPIQSNDVTLPNGNTWTQNVYLLEDNVIVVAIGRQVEMTTHAIIIFTTQIGLMAETPTLNQVLLSHTVTGESNQLDRSPDYVDQDTFTEQEITLNSDGYELPGTLSVPNGEGPFPAAVIVHGSGPNDRDGTLGLNKPYRDIAQGLASQGIAVLRYDKRTYQMQAMAENFTVDDEVTNDAVAAVNYLRDVDAIDPERIVVIGHSQGAMFAPRIAQQDGELAGIAMLAGTPNTFDAVLKQQIEYLQELDPNANVAGLDQLVEILDEIKAGTDAVEAFGGDEAQATYWESMLAYMPGPAARTLTIPMLILHGERDYQVTMADFEAWQSVLEFNDDVTFISYPTLNHLFMALGDLERLAIPADYNEAGFVDEQVINDLANWVLELGG